MYDRSRLAVFLAVSALLVAVRPAHSQLIWGADVVARSHYDWRGLARDGGLVLQPDAYVSAQSGTTSLTAGMWTTWSLASAGADGVGFGRGPFREAAPWVEGEMVVGGWVDVAAGWQGAFVRVDSAVPSRIPRITSTNEIYARLRVRAWPVVVPQVSVYEDVDAARGTYVEAGLDLRVPVWTRVFLPVGSLVLSSRLGLAYGLAPNPAAPSQFWYYARDGITHLDLGAYTVVGPLIPADGPVTLSVLLAWHLEDGVDPQARLVAPLTDRRWRNTFALGLSLWGPRCRPARRICR